MKLKVFSIPAVGDETAEAALNLFTAQHRIVQIDRQLIQDGGASFWSVCVGYFETQSRSEKLPQNKTRVDYRAVLSAEDFRHYAALREWRKAAADRDGIPAFGVFTNEQLAAIVRLPVLSLSALMSIDGVGEKKTERYGKDLIALLGSRRKGSTCTDPVTSIDSTREDGNNDEA